jgi:hypothetical protein
MNAATAASYSLDDITGVGLINFSLLRVIGERPARIAAVRGFDSA